jgi:hypothetical protein
LALEIPFPSALGAFWLFGILGEWELAAPVTDVKYGLLRQQARQAMPLGSDLE